MQYTKKCKLFLLTCSPYAGLRVYLLTHQGSVGLDLGRNRFHMDRVCLAWLKRWKAFQRFRPKRHEPDDPGWVLAGVLTTVLDTGEAFDSSTFTSGFSVPS